MSTQTMRVTLAAVKHPPHHHLAIRTPTSTLTCVQHPHVYSTQQTGPLTLAAFVAVAQHAQTTQHNT